LGDFSDSTQLPPFHLLHLLPHDWIETRKNPLDAMVIIAA